MSISSQIFKNKFKTYLLMFFFTIFVGGVVYIFARSLGFGIGAIGFSLIIVGLMNFFSYYFSDRMVLAIIAAVLAPIAAMLIQLAISRRREFLADASGANLTRYPDGLARALEKISSFARVSPTARTAIAHLYISNPVGDKKTGGNWLVSLFNTHPPVSERIKILRAL